MMMESRAKVGRRQQRSASEAVYTDDDDTFTDLCANAALDWRFSKVTAADHSRPVAAVRQATDEVTRQFPDKAQRVTLERLEPRRESAEKPEETNSDEQESQQRQSTGERRRDTFQAFFPEATRRESALNHYQNEKRRARESSEGQSLDEAQRASLERRKQALEMIAVETERMRDYVDRSAPKDPIEEQRREDLPRHYQDESTREHKAPPRYPTYQDRRYSPPPRKVERPASYPKHSTQESQRFRSRQIMDQEPRYMYLEAEESIKPSHHKHSGPRLDSEDNGIPQETYNHRTRNRYRPEYEVDMDVDPSYSSRSHRRQTHNHYRQEDSRSRYQNTFGGSEDEDSPPPRSRRIQIDDDVPQRTLLSRRYMGSELRSSNHHDRPRRRSREREEKDWMDYQKEYDRRRRRRTRDPELSDRDKIPRRRREDTKVLSSVISNYEKEKIYRDLKRERDRENESKHISRDRDPYALKRLGEIEDGIDWDDQRRETRRARGSRRETGKERSTRHGESRYEAEPGGAEYRDRRRTDYWEDEYRRGTRRHRDTVYPHHKKHR